VRSRAIADEIQLTLGDHASLRRCTRPSYPATYEATTSFRGQYFWNKRTVEGFQQAIAYQEAIAKDPNYARYAGLADYALLGASMVPQLDFMQKARAARCGHSSSTRSYRKPTPHWP
jgi:hypothetical protein